MITLLSADRKQYKANLHCHSTLSDGRLTPAELKAAYKANGYSVLAITDHERSWDHSAMTEDDFLMLTGYEMYIRPDKRGRYDAFEPEIHMNLFARDPHNVGMIAFDNEYSHYISDEEKALLPKIGKCELPRRYQVGYINRVIADAKANGYIVGYNHPYWSMESMEQILGYEGFFSMEMCNFSSYVSNELEYNGQIYDMLLRAGKRLAVNSSDDNHNKHPFGDPLCDSFGGFTYILADRLDYPTVFAALEAGEFYSSMGPQIHSVTVEGDTAHIVTGPVDRITMYNGGKAPLKVCAPVGEKITEAAFKISPLAPYIRFSALDGGWRYADTRGFFRDEFEEK